MKKYLYIFEDGEILLGDAPSDEDMEASFGGYVTIVNMENGTTLYPDGTWKDIKGK